MTRKLTAMTEDTKGQVIGDAIHLAWGDRHLNTSRSMERPCWHSGRTSPEATQGFYHGSVYLGQLRRQAADGSWTIESRHKTKYRSMGLASVVAEFIRTYKTAWETVGREAWNEMEVVK